MGSNNHSLISFNLKRRLDKNRTLTRIIDFKRAMYEKNRQLFKEVPQTKELYSLDIAASRNYFKVKVQIVSGLVISSDGGKKDKEKLQRCKSEQAPQTRH